MGLGLSDYPESERRVDERRGAAAADGWLKFLIPLVLSALVAYFTATGAIREQVATVRTNEEAHFQEVLRRLGLIQEWMNRQDARRP